MSNLVIGDRVRITRQESAYLGQEGTVYDILPWRPAPYHVRPDGWPEHQAGIAYMREELEPITSAARQAMCPFCPLLLPKDPDLWQPIDHAASVQIGGVRACEDCAVTTSAFKEAIPRYLAQVARRAELTYQAMRAIMEVYAMQVQAHLEARHA